jgi:hypothetical protein
MWWQTTNSQRILYFTLKSFFFMNNLNKLPLGVDFTAGGLNQLQITHSAFTSVHLLTHKQKTKQKMLLSSMLKLRSVRAIPNVITHLSFVFPTNFIWLIYYIVTQ